MTPETSPLAVPIVEGLPWWHLDGKVEVMVGLNPACVTVVFAACGVAVLLRTFALAALTIGVGGGARLMMALVS